MYLNLSWRFKKSQYNIIQSKIKKFELLVTYQELGNPVVFEQVDTRGAKHEVHGKIPVEKEPVIQPLQVLEFVLKPFPIVLIKFKKIKNKK